MKIRYLNQGIVSSNVFYGGTIGKYSQNTKYHATYNREGWPRTIFLFVIAVCPKSGSVL